MGDLTKENFVFLTDMIKSYSGISLSEEKVYLLDGRLLPLASKYGLGDLNDLTDYIKQNHDESILIEIIEAMTTNESFFFRDEKTFKILTEKLVPDILKKNPGKNSIKIWSAACSTGQEAYSAAMAFLEKPELANIKFEIYGTDLDFNVVEKAREGLFTQFEVQRGVPINLLIKYFTQEGDLWRVKDILKEKVRFDKFNLLDNAATNGKFDIVFCRNVLIYFDSATKEQVVQNLVRCMDKHSSLLLGAAESLMSTQSGLVQYKDEEGKYIPGVFVFGV